MDTLIHDVRYGLRTIARKPGFSIVAIMVLALGIGANAAVFSVVNSVLLRPINFPNSDRLVMMWNRSPGLNIAEDWLSTGEYFDLKQAKSFEDVAAAFVNTVNLTGVNANGDQEPERIGRATVTSSLFSVLEANVAKGRAFLPDENQVGKPRTAIISDALWQRHFGSDPAIIGRSIVLDGKDYTVVGILARNFPLNKETLPSFSPVTNLDVLVPLPLPDSAGQERKREDYTVIGRLKQGVSPAQAQSEVDTIVARLKHDFPQNYPPNSGFTISVVPMLEHAVGSIRSSLMILLGAVAFVLLIACANIANLLLSRAAGRRQEIAVRTALGARRSRLVRQMLTESMLLAITGGSLGLLFALWGVAALKWINPGNIPRIGEIKVDATVLIFTAAVSLLTGCLFGVVPAFRGSHISVIETLKEGGRIRAAGLSNRARGFLVVVEIALSLVLLIGAGLLMRSFARLSSVEPGFSVDRVTSFYLSLPSAKYSSQPLRQTFFHQFLDKVKALPGVESAGAVSELPLSGELAWTPVWVEGYKPMPGETLIQSDLHLATPDYFNTLRIPLMEGRYFDEHDSADSQRVAIVDEGFVRQLLPGQDPLGKRVKLGSETSDSPWSTIVGVVKSVRHYGLDANPRITCYFPHKQYPNPGMYVVVRSASDSAILPGISGALRTLDPDIPMYSVETMQRRLSESLARRRFSMIALAAFAAVAMVLAIVGIYGVISYSVTQRTREMGIRMALGANRSDVLKMVAAQGSVLLAIGIATGLAGALLLTRLMSGLLYGISGHDPFTFCVIPLILAAAGFLAQYFPARRASRVDPMVALRHE